MRATFEDVAELPLDCRVGAGGSTGSALTWQDHCNIIRQTPDSMSLCVVSLAESSILLSTYSRFYIQQILQSLQ